MALRIRLSRGGTKKRPHYAIVVADSHSPRDGRFIEKIGFYNPLLPRDHADRLKLDLEKAKAWVAKGAVASDRVHRFLADAGVVKPLTKSNPEKGQAEEEGAGTRQSGGRRRGSRNGFKGRTCPATFFWASSSAHTASRAR